MPSADGILGELPEFAMEVQIGQRGRLHIGRWTGFD